MQHNVNRIFNEVSMNVDDENTPGSVFCFLIYDF